jgi:hypothetical protein
MLELGIGADMARGVAWVFRTLVLAAVIFALWNGKGWKRKLLNAALVLLVLGMAVWSQWRAEYRHQRKYEAAKALFDERCKTAGEKIYRTAVNVEGVLLLRVRQYDDVGKSNPMMDGAATAYEFTGDDYIRSFLLFEKESTHSSRGALSEAPTPRPGYRFVDAIDPRDQKRYRYTLDPSTRLQRREPVEASPRYGVLFEDIVNPDERKHWVAGSTVKVLDLEANETMAEFTRYVIDPGQGSREGQRTPWLFAKGCGMNTSYGTHSSRLFVDQVLKPMKGSSK